MFNCESLNAVSRELHGDTRVHFAKLAAVTSCCLQVYTFVIIHLHTGFMLGQ